MPALPRVIIGKMICATIQKARCRPKSYPTLVRRLEPKIVDWIKGATDWQDVDVGQSRVLIFETPLPNGARCFFRFWPESRMPLLDEISSGIQDEALRAALGINPVHPIGFRIRRRAATDIRLDLRPLFLE